MRPENRRIFMISNTGRVAFRVTFPQYALSMWGLPHHLVSAFLLVKLFFAKEKVIPNHEFYLAILQPQCQKKSAARIKRYWNQSNGAIMFKTPFVMNSTAIAASIIPITLETTFVQCPPSNL